MGLRLKALETLSVRGILQPLRSRPNIEKIFFASTCLSLHFESGFAGEFIALRAVSSNLVPKGETCLSTGGVCVKRLDRDRLPVWVRGEPKGVEYEDVFHFRSFHAIKSTIISP